MDASPQRPVYRPGTPVSAVDGDLGVVAGTPDPDVLAVRDDAGRSWRLPLGLVDDERSTEERVVLRAGRADLDGYAVDAITNTGASDRTGAVASEAGIGATTVGGDAERLLIPVREEELVPQTFESERGRVVVRKRIETVPIESNVEVSHDEVDVERVAVNREIEAMPTPRQEGDTLIVPVVEEILVTEKRLMLREEIRITRRRVAETVAIRDEVRKERVEVEEQVYETK